MMFVALLGLASSAHALAVYDANGHVLAEGALISAGIAGDPDIYIIKLLPHGQYAGYKRLFLNPAIFNMYAHLGGFQNVHPVAATTRDLFETSGIFRNCETNNARVWATEITGEDDGVLHHVDMTGAQTVAQDAQFFNKVFCINTREENFYIKSIHAYTALSQLPRYERLRGTVIPVITSVTAYKMTTEPAGWWIRIVGTLANGCMQLTGGPSFSRDGNTFLVSLLARSEGQVCTQIVREFTQAVRLSDLSLAPGLYSVYVNGQSWTSFIIPTPTPSPLY